MENFMGYVALIALGLMPCAACFFIVSFVKRFKARKKEIK